MTECINKVTQADRKSTSLEFSPFLFLLLFLLLLLFCSLIYLLSAVSTRLIIVVAAVTTTERHAAAIKTGLFLFNYTPFTRRLSRLPSPPH
jgi:uncharacterized protein (UPF0333 family)